MQPSAVFICLNPASLATFFDGEIEPLFCLSQSLGLGGPGFVLGLDLVRETKLVVEFTDDDEIGLEVGVSLDALAGGLQLHKRIGRLTGGKQVAAVF